MLTPPRFEGTVAVGQGRRLSFSEFGPVRGRPVIWLPGTPGARRQIPQPARAAADRLGIRIIGLDRPGVGQSSPYGYRRVLEFADDMGLAADALGLDRFAMLGLSGGGPYLLACAFAMPQRFAAGAVLGGVAPTVGPDAAEGGVVSLTARFNPMLTRCRVPLSLALASMLFVARPFGSPALDLYARFSPPGDRRLLARPEFKAMFLDDLLEAAGHLGIRGPLYDVLLFGRDWGFSVRDIEVPIRWWHGDADHIVPLRHGEHVAGLIPGAELVVLSGESHLGSLATAEQILVALLADWDGAG